MSTSQTPNYGLNQWSPEDQFLREEFNADNARTDAALAALAAAAGEKAAQADLSALAAVVEGKAAQSALDSLKTTMDKKANQSALDSLVQTVNGKAAQSSLDSLSSTVSSLTQTVNTKAAQTALNSLTATVNTKASQADLNAVSAANKWVKLCETTSGTESVTFNVILPALDYSQYSQLRFMFDCTTTTGNAVLIRLNGVADSTYFCAAGNFTSTDRPNFLLYITCEKDSGFGGEGSLGPFRGGTATFGRLNPVAAGSWFACPPASGIAQIPFRDLRSLNFYVTTGVIKAGAWCAVYGLLR